MRGDLRVEALGELNEVRLDEGCENAQTRGVIGGEADVPFQFVNEGFTNRHRGQNLPIVPSG